MTGQRLPRFRKKERLTLSLLGALPFPLLSVAGTLDAFSANREELGFSAGDFLPLCAVIGLFASVLLFLLLFLLPDGGFRVVFPIILAFSLSAAILPFVNRFSGLPGDRLSEASAVQTVCGAAIPVLLLGVGIVGFLLCRRSELLTTVSLFVLIPLLVAGVVSLFSTSLSNPGVFAKNEEGALRSGTITTEGLSDFGEDGNVLYFCVDRLDEEFCRVAESIDPTVFDSLDGFTRYTDHVSLYSNTYPAVCYMLTGREADFSLSRAENFRRGYGNPRLLGALREAGYGIGIYADAFYSYGAMQNVADYADNLLSDGHFETERKPELSCKMLALSLYRSAPSVLSPLFSSLSTDSLTEHAVYVRDDLKGTPYNSANDKVKAELVRLESSVREGKRFSYIHIAGMHNVLYADADPQRTLSVLKESLSIVGVYLNALKKTGLYRDATIVITGDHPSPISDRRSVEEPRMTALFVKRRGDAETPLRVSTAQVSQGQIASEILDSEGFSLTDDDPIPLSHTPEGADVERRHHFIVLTSEGFRCETYRIEGPAADFSNWKTEDPVSYKKGLYQ